MKEKHRGIDAALVRLHDDGQKNCPEVASSSTRILFLHTFLVVSAISHRVVDSGQVNTTKPEGLV